MAVAAYLTIVAELCLCGVVDGEEDGCSRKMSWCSELFGGVCVAKTLRANCARDMRQEAWCAEWY
jgi:hypothetical protein